MCVINGLNICLNLQFYRYESVIIPREEGKIVFESNVKKPKKTKGVYKLPQVQYSIYI